MKNTNQFWSPRTPWVVAMIAVWLAASAIPAHADACATGVAMSPTTVSFSPNYDFTDPVQHTTIVTSLRITGVVNGCAYLIGAQGGGAARSLTGSSGHTMAYQLY